jgi:hypothetical protein
MTIGNLGTVGINAGSNYFAPLDEARPASAVNLEQRDTHNYLQADYAETIQPVTAYEPAGERPDFAAINFIRNSLPEPIPAPVQNMQTFTIEDFETGVSSTGEPQMTLAEFQAQQEQRMRTEVEQSTPSVQEAIEQDGQNAQAASVPDTYNVQEMNTPAWEPRITVESEQPQTQMQGQPLPNTQPQTPTQEIRVEERVAESATVQTSYERVEEAANSRLTPAQEQGVEEYTRIQGYSDPTSASLATSQLAA